jgi:DNA/RNA endonuclease G (NUC1)
MSFKFPQQPSDSAQLSDFLVSINHIEEKTKLNFSPQFDDAQESDYETDAASDVWSLN